MEELIHAEHISKSFSGVAALRNVSFNLKKGEVHALLGENGAGKSTLVKIISGVYTRDSGNLIIKGQTIHNFTPKQAQNLGISIIHQELNLCPHLTVAENIFLGREKTKFGLLSKKLINQEATKYLKQLGVEISPDALVSSLPVSKQQMVEICRTISINADIIIMDEPTSALTEREIEELFNIIKSLKEQGKGIIYISHRLEELSKIVDRVTILRDGQFVKTLDFKSTNLSEIISLMVGRTLNEKYPHVKCSIGDLLLKVENLTAPKGVNNVSFELRRGEIVAIAGLMGSGRSEMIRALFGADPKTSGKIWLNNREIKIKEPIDAIKAGLFCIPEDRKIEGLCIRMNVAHNLLLPNLDFISKLGIISNKLEKNKSIQIINELKIKTSGIDQIVRNLSGGNQQKIVVGKWLFRNAQVIIFDEPTRGIDVASKIEIYNIMNNLKQNGIGIMFISSELPEVIGMSDRVLVMCNGKITANLITEHTNQEEILTYATKFTD